MDFVSPLCKVLTVYLISCGFVFGTNFPPAIQQAPIPFQPQSSVPLDFGSDVLSETVISNFKPAEILLDSPVVTELTTENSASDQIPNEATFSKVIAEDWSPPTETIGQVATPRPDVVPESEKVQFSAPASKTDSTRTPLPASVWVFSRGITGQYAEQGWIPFDPTVPAKSPPVQGDVSNINVPGNFPIFPTPDLFLQPKGWSQWSPSPVSPSTIPRSVPDNVPVIIIQNVSIPLSAQPPPTFVNAPLPSGVNPALFPPVGFFPKKITFPAPKTFIFPSPPMSEAPVTSPPVDETPAPPEVTTTPTATPEPTIPPPPSPPPPPPPYFIRPPKKQIIPIFSQFIIPSSTMKLTPIQTLRPVYVSKTSTDDYQFPKIFSPSEYKVPALPSTINSWVPGPNVMKSQFIPQNLYPKPPNYNRQKPIETSFLDGMPTNTAMDGQLIPPLSSDLWIIKGPSNAAPKSAIPSGSTPIGLLPKPKPMIPIRGRFLSPVLDQEVVTTFPGKLALYTIYPTRFSAPPNQPSSFPFPTYSSDSLSQLDSFPVSYTYPAMPYPMISQPSQPIRVRLVSNKENCSIPASRNLNFMSSFYDQPQSPVYLPVLQNSYNVMPMRPSVPQVLFQTLPADSRPPPITETPVAQEIERRKDQERVPAEEPQPKPLEGSVAGNAVISPIFPFINPPVSFPKPAATNGNLRRPPYFFRYGQSDDRGPLQYRAEESSPDGIIKGSYGFRGADGVLRKVNYAADSGRYGALVPASEPTQQNPDPDVKEDPSAGYLKEKNTPESEA